MASDQPALWITEAEVVDALDLGQAVDALRAGLRLEQDGEAQQLEKTHAIWGRGHTLHALGATFEGMGLVGAKTWAHTEGGATPLLVIWDSDAGRLVAVIEAFALGQLRTSGMSGVATDVLARRDATRFALVGAGAQALAQAAAVMTVRAITEIAVFSRDQTKAKNLATRLDGEVVGVSVRATDSVADAVVGADIVTTVTRSRDPILDVEMLAPGAHINAVGAITPERRELAADVVNAAKIIACDTVSGARRHSTDLGAVFGDDDARWNAVLSLSTVVVDPPTRPDDVCTLYKGMGTGLADVALGAAILAAVRERGLGHSFPQPTRATPRLFAGNQKDDLTP